jgi:hypothetical protein
MSCSDDIFNASGSGRQHELRTALNSNPGNDLRRLPLLEKSFLEFSREQTPSPQVRSWHGLSSRQLQHVSTFVDNSFDLWYAGRRKAAENEQWEVGRDER